MSYQAAEEPRCSVNGNGVELRIEPRERSLGDFSVRRVLPSSARRMVGPFIFFDHMGPAEFPPGRGIQVRPHPHIGLATITYLFEGEMLHRDSLGIVQPIRAGAVNLMTAGRGIVHSERAGEDLDRHARLHGIQSWMALPDGQEEIEPSFEHTPAGDLPQIETGGAVVRVIIGEAYGERSPVRAYSPTLYLDCRLAEGTALALPDGVEERAAYVVSGSVDIAGAGFDGGVMAVAVAGAEVRLEAKSDSRVMVIGGQALGNRRHIWWNFVSSSRSRMERAKADWKAGRFDAVPGDTEHIPLPE